MEQQPAIRPTCQKTAAKSLVTMNRLRCLNVLIIKFFQEKRTC